MALIEPVAAGGSAAATGPLVIAVVPVHNRRELTLRFIARWQALTYPHRKLVLVDDGSADGTAQAVAQAAPETIVLHESGDAWWAGATNTGIARALAEGADLILTINDDATFGPDLLDRLVTAASRHPDAIVGCRLMRQDDPEVVWGIGTAATFTGRRLWTLLRAGERWQADLTGDDTTTVPAICGNGALIPATVFRRVGTYDARCLPQYHADSDLVLRAAAAGYPVRVALGAVIINHIAQPLPKRRWDVLFSRRSPLYLPALWTILWRHGPRWKAPWILVRQLLPPLILGPQRGRRSATD